MLRINGIIDHGFNARFFWLHAGLWGKGANLTCSLLLNHLWLVATSHSKLPPTLYLQVHEDKLFFIYYTLICMPLTKQMQMDNCSGENKNKYVLAFLCWLVHLKASVIT
jgi:hypothetical protein